MHSVLSVLMGRTVSWIPTNAKHTTISPAFRQTIRIVKAYVATYLLLILLAFRTGDIHLLNINYLSIQFWIFWNLSVACVLLVNFINTKKAMSGQPSLFMQMNPFYAPSWQLAIFSFVVGFLIGLPALMYVMPSVGIQVAQRQTAAAHVLPTSIPTSTPQPTTTPSPSPTSSPSPTQAPVMKTHTPPETKEYGGWYWQPEAECAQRWLLTRTLITKVLHQRNSP